MEETAYRTSKIVEDKVGRKYSIGIRWTPDSRDFPAPEAYSSVLVLAFGIWGIAFTAEGWIPSLQRGIAVLAVLTLLFFIKFLFIRVEK